MQDTIQESHSNTHREVDEGTWRTEREREGRIVFQSHPPETWLFSDRFFWS